MTMLRRSTAAVLLSLAAAVSAAPAAPPADLNLRPKYGLSSKSDAQRAADDKFLAEMDQLYAGDRRKAAAVAAGRGWESLRADRADEAMRRFNQAWLLDPTNAHALWGMGAVTGQRNEVAASMVLFAEAEPALRGDLDFRIDHARTLAKDAVQSKDPQRIDAVLARFWAIDQQAPTNVRNLQNWIVTLAILDRDDEAWALVQRARAVRPDALDPRLVADLSDKRAAARKPVTTVATKGAAAPELWSGHQVLTIPATACADRAKGQLERLGFTQVARNDLYTYGNRDGHRAAVKCVAVKEGSFVYYAVAGADRATAEALRNQIAADW